MSVVKNNDSHVSGVSPFFSSEDINVSISQLVPSNESVRILKKKQQCFYCKVPLKKCVKVSTVALFPHFMLIYQ